MRRFLIVAFTAASFCCLALTFPSRAMAGVTSGTAKCPSGDIHQMGDAVGCVIPLPVGQPGHGGSVNPNDWGMCGVLGLTGNFGPPTVARIIVNTSGYYAVELEAYMASVLPTLNWTCVLFSDFNGVPPPSEATSFGPVNYNGGSDGGAKKIAGSVGNACIWAGVFGNLETLNINDAGGTDGAFGFAYAQFDTPYSLLESQNVTSYAICSAYSAASWKGWNFVNPRPNVSAPPHAIKLGGLDDTHYWCYLQGIEAHLLYPTYPVGVISASLEISGGDYSIDATPPGGTWTSYNCLPLTQ
jgi:hypothetical protein